MSQNNALVKEVTKAMHRFVFYGPRVAVLRDDAEKESKGGLIIPDEAQRVEAKGTIIKLGAGYAEAAVAENAEGIEVGHRVTFNKFDGVAHAMPVNGRTVELLVMHVGNLYVGWTLEEGKD